MSATPEPEVRYWKHPSSRQISVIRADVEVPAPWYELTVSPLATPRTTPAAHLPECDADYLDARCVCAKVERTTPADETAEAEPIITLRSDTGNTYTGPVSGVLATHLAPGWRLESLAASPAPADTADGLDPEVAARWASCDRAEAIRQAERSHAEMLRWGALFEQMRDERDATREQIAQDIEAESTYRTGRDRRSWGDLERITDNVFGTAARIAREHATPSPDKADDLPDGMVRIVLLASHQDLRDADIKFGDVTLSQEALR